MKNLKIIFSFILFAVFVNFNEGYSQTKSCSEKTVDHYKDPSTRDRSGLEKVSDRNREMDRAGAAADKCRDKNACERSDRSGYQDGGASRDRHRGDKNR